MNISKMKENVVNHFKTHKELYIGIGVGVCLAGITYVIMRSTRVPSLIVGAEWPETASTEGFSFLNGNTIGDGNSFVTTIHNGKSGHPGFVTRCIETGELFDTQGSASRHFGIDERLISQHLNHGVELQENIHFERLGVFS